jgi:hypothetical protein
MLPNPALSPLVAELHLQVPCPQPAHLLRTEIFTCTIPTEPEPEPTPASAAAGEAASNEKNHDLCYVHDEDTCATTMGCVWCLSNEAPAACYFEEKAQRCAQQENISLTWHDGMQFAGKAWSRTFAEFSGNLT